MSPQRADHTAATGDFRLDIQGLRAIAVGLVVLFHVRPDWVPGGFVGVDVFFVVSGFLITGMLAREIERTGRLSLIGFYARRARRLLPAATSVLVLVGLASLLILPQIRWQETALELAASALYVENVWLYLNSIDYLAQGAPASPLQHYWSLSIEEQYYIVWPLLLLIVLRLRGAARSRTSAIVLAALLFAASLALSIAVAAIDPQAGYFRTWTRIWELTLGALVALLLSRSSLGDSASARPAWPAPLGVLLAASGIAGILAAAFAFDRATAFPGAAALLPTGATAAIIVAGSKTTFGRSPWLLGLRAFQYLGNISYSLYLWHWPVIVLFGALAGRQPTLVDSVAIVAVSIGLAQLTKSGIEDPLRYKLGTRGIARAFAYSGAFMAACLCVAGAVYAYVAQREQALLAVARDDVQHPGALILAAGGGRAGSYVADFTPALPIAKDDIPRLYRDGCQVSPTSPVPHECDFGDKNGELVVALVGDSHAAQWLPALEEMARRHRWKIITHTKSSCPFIDTVVQSRNASSCAEWNKRVLQEIIDAKPDVVVTSLIYNYVALGAGGSQDSNERLAAGLERTWSKLTTHGIAVVAIRTTPHFPFDASDCLAMKGVDGDGCSLPKDEAILAVDPVSMAAARSPAVTLADMNRFICPGNRCMPIVGNVLVYRDKHHLTATYATTLASALEPFVIKASAGHAKSLKAAAAP